MILDNLFENTVQGYDNLRQLISAHSQKQPATIMVGGEPVTLDYPEVNFMIGQYKAYMRAGKQEKFLRDLEDPVAFDRHMKILRDLIDKQQNFQGSVPGEREVPGEKTRPWESLGETIATLESMMSESDIGQSVKATGYKNIGLIATSLDRNPTEPITLRFSNGSTYEMDDPREKKWFVAKLRTYTRKNLLDRLIIDMADRGRFEEHLAQLADYLANQEMTKPQQGYEESQQVSEVKKKKQKSSDLDRDEIVDPKLKSELIKARAKYPAAASDLEAFLKAARNQITTGHKDIESVKDETSKQQNLINQIVQIDRNQQKELQALDQENDDQENEIKRLQDLNDKLAQAVASMGQTRQELPTKRTQRQTTKKKDTKPQTRSRISKIVPYEPAPEPVITKRTQPPTLVPEPADVPQGSLDLKTSNGPDILVKPKTMPEPLKLVASKEPRQTAVNESSKYYAICVEGQAMVKYTDISEAHRNSVRLKQQFPDANITTKIFEAGEFNRAGYNAIKNVSDWEEKMRVMQELLKNNELMQDPEAKAAIQQRIGDLNRVGIQQGYVNEQNMPGTKIPQKSIIQGYTVFYDPKTKIVSITRGGDSAEAAIEQARVNTTSIKAFRQVVERLIDKIETEQGVAEGQLDEKQDACYHKVKSRYKVWPSAYASGALVQCRKKGAANWGNKSKK